MEICLVLFFKPEIVQHLFFECTYARLLWMAVHIVLALNQPLNVYYLFNNWYPIRDKTLRSFFIDGSCWSIWLTRNKIVVDKCPQKPLLYLLFRECIGYRSGPVCNGVRRRKISVFEACHKLENAAMHLFAASAWPFI